MTQYFAIGHITRDINIKACENKDSKLSLGGSVSYSTLTAKKLGLESHIITKINPSHPYVKQIEKMGIKVHCLPINNRRKHDIVTSFINRYDKNGQRTQAVNEIAEEITLPDLKYISKLISPNSIIHIAPVIDEVDPALITPLSQTGYLLVTPQGYFRHRENNGRVVNIPWTNISSLSYASIVILSTEDITFNNKINKETIEQLKRISPLFILTKQRYGSVIFHKGKKPIEITAYPLKKQEEIDFTGCGDVYATTFVIDYLRNKNLKKAGDFASWFAAKKISDPEYF